MNELIAIQKIAGWENPACGYPAVQWGVGSCINSLVNGYLL